MTKGKTLLVGAILAVMAALPVRAQPTPIESNQQAYAMYYVGSRNHQLVDRSIYENYAACKLFLDNMRPISVVHKMEADEAPFLGAPVHIVCVPVMRAF